MQYLIIKSLHVIFIVTWFAGLFYIVRLFIYDREADEKPEQEKQILKKQFLIMKKRLWYGITWPSMIFTLIFGSWLLVLNPDLLKMGFMHIKLTLVLGLLVYHFYCHLIFIRQQKNHDKLSSLQLRLLNEGATIFLVGIIFAVIMKQGLNWKIWLVSLTIFTLLMLFFIVKYNKRNKK